MQLKHFFVDNSIKTRHFYSLAFPTQVKTTMKVIDIMKKVNNVTSRAHTFLYVTFCMLIVPLHGITLEDLYEEQILQLMEEKNVQRGDHLCSCDNWRMPDTFLLDGNVYHIVGNEDSFSVPSDKNSTNILMSGSVHFFENEA